MTVRKNKSGFTLLEMLLAMSMMSMLAGSLYASLHIAFRARDSAAAAIDPPRTAELALELLRQDIESALPPIGILAGEFIGTDAKDESGQHADTLILHSSAHNAAPGERASEIRQVELAFEPLSEGEEPVLVRRITTNLLAPEVPEPVEEVLCRNVRALNLSYFDGYDWLDNWDSTTQANALPVAAEVTLEVSRSEQTDPNAHGYEVSRIFLLPCGGTAESSGGSTVQR